MPNEDFEYEAGTTSAEFLANLPEKTKEDHEHDLQEMKKVSKKVKDINLNPVIDLETAITNTKNLLVKDTLEKHKRLEDIYTD